MTAPRAAALAALAAVAVYSGSLGHGFVWDDHIHIEAAPFVQTPRNLRVLASLAFWTGRVEVEGSARPLLLATLLVDRALWGAAPGGYHLTNVLLHASAAAAFTLFAAGAAASVPAGLVAGLVFALHPVQSEAVCGVMFRADLLSALFVFVALLAARRAREGKIAAWTAAASAAFALALLAKENAVVFPALLWLSWRLEPPPRPKARVALLQLAAFTAVLGAYWAFRSPRAGYEPLAAASGFAPSAPAAAAPRAKASAPAPAAAPAPAPVFAEPELKTVQIDPSPPPWVAALRGPGDRARAAFSVLLDYVRLAAWPTGLQADRSPVLDRLGARSLGGAAAALALLAGAWALRARAPAASLGLAWFLASLLPVSGLVPLHNLIAERYLYLPLAGLALAAAVALEAVARRTGRPRLALLCAGAALAAAYGAATARRVPAWKDDGTLFAGRIESDGSRLRYNRGRLARTEGRFNEARDEYRRSLALDPRSVESLVNLAEVEGALGNDAEELALLVRAVGVNPLSSVAQEAHGGALERRGRRREALDAFARAVGDDARSPSARARYAVALAQSGRGAEARREMEIAVRLDPANAQVQYANGRLRQDQGRLDEAASAFRGAVRADAGHGLSWANLGVCLHKQGRLNEALGAMRSAARLLPASADARRNLGALLDDLGRLEEAAAAFAESVKLDAGSPAGWHGYGVVLQKLGRKEQAVAAYERALALEPGKTESLANLAKLDASAAPVLYANGLLLQDQGRIDEAAASFRAAVERAPAHGLAWANLGVCLHRRGRLDEALDAMRTAVEKLPRSAEARRNLGALHDDAGRGAQAEAAYAAAVKLDARSAPAWHAYGVVLEKGGSARAAARAYERALALEPTRVESLVNLAGLQGRAGDFDGAQASLARALMLRPRDATVRAAADAFERLTGRVVPIN